MFKKNVPSFLPQAMFETLPSVSGDSPTYRHRSVAVIFRLHQHGWSGEAQPASDSLAQARCAVSYPSNFFPFPGEGQGKCSPSPCDISSIYDCEPRTVVRVRIRGIVVRIRVNETAIRIRTVVRPQHHTRAMPASAFLLSLPPLGWRAASVSSVVHHYILLNPYFFAGSADG